MTEYNYIHRDDYDKSFKDRSGVKWQFFSKKAARKMNLLGNHDVLGDYFIKVQKNTMGSLNNAEDMLFFSRSEKLSSMRYSVAGYMVCGQGDEKLIRVVKRNFRLAALIIAILLLLALIGGFLFWQSHMGPVFEDEAIAYKMPDGTKNEDENKIMIPGYGDLTMQANTDELYAALVNPEGNLCNFQYSIVLTDSNETLYESALIRPGTAVTNVKLNRKIRRGTYDIQVVVKAYDLEDYEKQLNGGVVETTLIAK